MNIKKFLIPVAIAAVLSLSACAPANIQITDESFTPTDATAGDASGNIVSNLSPDYTNTSLPFDVPKKESDIDLSYAEKIYEEDATIKGLGADKIIRTKKYDLFYFTSGEVPVTIASCKMNDQVYISYYIDGEFTQIFTNDKSWYMKNGEVSFVVDSHTNEAEATIYTFYNNGGEKLFARLGDDYYDKDNDIMSSAQVNELKEIYDRAIEFADEN